MLVLGLDENQLSVGQMIIIIFCCLGTKWLKCLMIEVSRTRSQGSG